MRGRRLIGRVALRLARLRALGAIVGFIIEKFSWTLPIKFILKSDSFVAFRHPVPIKTNHVLVIPLKRISSSLKFLSSVDDCRSLIDFSTSLVKLVPEGDVSLSTNIGIRQEVKQVHFHIVPTDGEFIRSEKQAKSIVELAHGVLREIESDGGLTSIEYWHTRNAEIDDFPAAIASIATMLRPAIERFKGSSVFLYISKHAKEAVKPSMRIVVENPDRISVIHGIGC